MLNQPIIAKGDIVSIKTVANEELVAEVAETPENGDVTVKKVRSIMLVPSQNGQLSPSAPLPWLLGNIDAKVTIKGEHIIAMAESDPELAKFYRSSTSEIEIATQMP